MYEKLIKGLAIYRQNHTKSYYVRLRIDKKEIKRTLSTSDIDEAKTKAWSFYFEMNGRKQAGLPILETKVLTIHQALKEVLKQIENNKVQKPIYKDYRLVITNFIAPYFKNKNIKELTSKNIRLYFESLDLSMTRKRINNTCFKKLFQFLEEEEHLKSSEIPTLPKIDNNKVENREAFSNNDYQKILKNLKDFHLTGKQNFKTKEYRQVLYYYFIFLCETGVRAGEEVKNLLFDEIEEDGQNYFITIKKGKTKGYSRPRKIALSNSAFNALFEIACIQNPDQNITLQNFTNINKLILQSSFDTMPCYVKVFNNFIEKMKSTRILKQHYTLYSCRHYFITNRLKNGVNAYVVAKYVGNTVEMLQRFYDHNLIENQENIDKLTETLTDEIRMVVF